MRKLRIGTLLFVLSRLAGTAPTSALAGETVSLLLPARATTSAGIFDAEDRLVRTLWSGRSLPAGPVAIEWDGRDDDGQRMAGGAPFVVRMLAHDVRYVWEGAIGNTSAAQPREPIHRGLHPISDMAVSASGDAFYVQGYNERQSAIHRFSTADPQRPTPLAHYDFRREFRFVATDGRRTYIATTGLVKPEGDPLREPATFVIALRIADGNEYEFAAGRVVSPEVPELRWLSAIDYERVDALTPEGGFRHAATGLAVQQRGRMLFVAHGPLNEIRVLDKLDGQVLARIATAAPGDLDVAPDDSLWVLSRSAGAGSVTHFRFVDGKWTPVASVAEGLVDPVAIGVSPRDGTLVVVDAGTDQLKAFDPRGKPLWMLGRAGGYRSGDPRVTTDRFWFGRWPTFLAFEADGSFWVGDAANSRNLRFSPTRQYRDQISFLPRSYVVAVDHAAPTRVFCHFLEFEVDYSRPLHDSWRLVRNWAAGLSQDYFGEFEGLQSVDTLSNGRTYGVIRRDDSPLKEIVELAPEGLRRTGVRLEVGEKLYPDGSLRSGRSQFNQLRVYSRPFTTLDESGMPHWGPPEKMAGIDALAPADPYYHDVPIVRGVNEATYPVTTHGVVVSFNPGTAAGYHLGGMLPGDSRWRWRASLAGVSDLTDAGLFRQRNGTYELGRGVQYPGNVVVTAGSSVIYGYHGEGWNGGQANQWMHYLDNGLFVGQFGRPVYPAGNRTLPSPESAGNAFSPQLVEVGQRLYLWHNDEGVHGGLNRWRIDGSERIRILSTQISPGSGR